MPEANAPLSVDSAVDEVMSLLGSDDAPAETPIENLSDEGAAERIGNEPEPEGDKPEGSQNVEAEAAPQEPPIEPPSVWDADAKERFKSLGPDWQKFIVEQERARESVFGKTQREAAEARKAAEVERTAVQQERQAYSQRLTQIIDVAQTMDPVLAEGAKTDWAKLAQEDPISAFQKKAAYDARLQQLNALAAERDRVSDQIRNEMLRRAEEKLASELKDEWTNPDKRKAFQSDVKQVLQQAGYAENEFANVTDARALLIARKAALYDKLMAQQATIAQAKKTPPAPKTVLKSQAKSDGSDQDQAVAKTLQRVKSSTRMEDQAALIASLL